MFPIWIDLLRFLGGKPPRRAFAGKVDHCQVRLDMDGETVNFPVKEIMQAYWVSHPKGTVLDAGRVVHDYLQ